MATWETKTIKDIVQGIEGNTFTLPVIQRRLVWSEEKMEMLFDSLLKGNSFGGIMVLEEERGDEPLFAYRAFSRSGEEHASANLGSLSQTMYLVIDGQQRLQAFYMGLKGKLNDKTLYFNLNSSPDDYEFRFAYQPDELSNSETSDKGIVETKCWYQAPALYDRLRRVQDSEQVADEITQKLTIGPSEERDRIRRNVNKFYNVIFAANTIGLSSVTVNRSQIAAEKLRIVELFRRLNDGGTRLSSLDLVASVFKGFDYRMERFFKEMDAFADMGLGQDEVIKLLFILQDEHAKEVTDVVQADADFALANQERLKQTLTAVRQFLHHAQLQNYYATRNRSVIPLYVVAYHIFHQSAETAVLPRLYDNFDANNLDFLSLKRWLSLSLLNHVFSRGSGWIPYRTGIRKIMGLMKQYKGDPFPVEPLLQMYQQHPLRFSADLTVEQLDGWDGAFVQYLIYNGNLPANRDVDHIHPRYQLGDRYPHDMVNSTANYQLLDANTNRHEKRAKPLAEWIKIGVADRESYLNRHLIPADPILWETEHFGAFIEARAAQITTKVRAYVPDASVIPLAETPVSEDQALAASADGEIFCFDLVALRAQLPAELAAHSILDDKTSWLEIFKAWGVGRRWYGSYRRALAQLGIHTVADLALVIMSAGIELWWHNKDGRHMYRFAHAGSNDEPMAMPTDKFGVYGWHIAHEELQKRGFDWSNFLV